MKRLLSTLTLLCCALSLTFAQLVITEIFYNAPGSDHTEFVEIYNNGATGVNLDGYTMGGVVFTFPNMMLMPGEFTFVTKDDGAFDRAFGITAHQWDEGVTSDGGEPLFILDAGGNLVDSVRYDDGQNGWPKLPDGYGFSLTLCDVNADNTDPDNWAISTTPTSYVKGGEPVFANPGALETCVTDPVVVFSFASGVINEGMGGDSLEIELAINQTNGSPVSVDISVDASSTTGAGDSDFTGMTFTFDGAADGFATIKIPFTDDGDMEATERMVLKLGNATNNAFIADDTYTAYVFDNDSPSSPGDLIVTGIGEGLTTNGRGMVVEFQAINFIPDLSRYGVGNANNGGGTDGAEYVFPPVPVNACEFVYLAEDAGVVEDFYGIQTAFETIRMFFSGDDAIELFEYGMNKVDGFGDENVDGTGEPWDYTDGWAYRVNGTGPDGAVFVLDNWTYSGAGALDGPLTNDGAANPFPHGTYEKPIGPGKAVITEIFYNAPGSDHNEFIEIYNAGGSPLDMTDWTIGGVVFTFPSFTLEPGAFVFVTKNASAFDNGFGMAAFQWDDGVTTDAGEDLRLFDANGSVADSVAYDDGQNGWPKLPDGFGFSLSLCDVDSDNNDPANWRTSTGSANYIKGGEPVFANPGALETCVTDPIVGFSFSSGNINEILDSIEVELFIGNTNGSPVSVDIIQDISVLSPFPVADTGDTDFNGMTFTFDGTADGFASFRIPITDDAIVEATEILPLALVNPTNNAVIVDGNFAALIYDDDSPSSPNDLVITGVSEGLTTTGRGMVVELQAQTDITDLSRFGIGNANNGGGTDGTEYVFPPVSANECDYIYVAEDTGMVANFYGIQTDMETIRMFFTGDDAIELFEFGIQKVDGFGDPNVDGSGEPWEYTNGWAYREDGTGPDGDTFVVGNWLYSGTGVLDGPATNDDAANPFPIGIFMCLGVNTFEPTLAEKISFYPNPTSQELVVETELELEFIQVSNILGQVVKTIQHPAQSEQLALGRLPAGTYTISFFTEDTFWSAQLVKQ